MDRDTDIGGAGSRFPTTRHSAIADAGSGDPEVRARGLETLVAAYWKPVYKYVRIRWRESNEDAKDLTQGFFARAVEKRFLEAFDPSKARFRTYLRVCLDGFVANEKKAQHREKRFPGSRLLSLDFESAEGELALEPRSDDLDPEEYFRREWVHGIFSTAVQRLDELCRKRGRETAWRIFEIYDLGDAPEPGEDARLTYDELAVRLSTTVTDVTNALAFTRRELRRIVLEILRESTGGEEEFRSEARAILGRRASRA
jgi:RNA polymerase sigma factor (sigma-70 family)